MHGLIADDIKSDIVLGLLTGEIRPDGAKAAASQAMLTYNRMFGRRDISMDADLGDGFTLAGIVSDGSFDVGESGIRVATAGS